jgi:hypothetical protein
VVIPIFIHFLSAFRRIGCETRDWQAEKEKVQSRAPFSGFSRSPPGGHDDFQNPRLQTRLGKDRDRLRSQGDVVFQIQRGLGVIFARLEGDDQAVLDGEDSVGLQVGVVIGVDLGDDGVVFVVGDLGVVCQYLGHSGGCFGSHHQVDVGRAHRSAVHQLQELPRGAYNLSGMTIITTAASHVPSVGSE